MQKNLDRKEVVTLDGRLKYTYKRGIVLIAVLSAALIADILWRVIGSSDAEMRELFN